MFTASTYFTPDEFKSETDSFNKNSLAILNTNARSFLRHKCEYEIFLDDFFQHNGFKFDILSFEETWLDENNCLLANIDGYKMVTKHKAGSKIGGGLAFYVSNDLPFVVKDVTVPVNMQNLFDCIFLEVEANATNVVIGLLYRSPSMNSIRQFCTFLEPILSDLTAGNKDVIILGDMNIDLLKYDEHVDTAEYLDLLFNNGFIPKVTVPTRITNTSSTLIDHTFLKLSNSNCHSGTITTDITDHFINYIVLEGAKQPKVSKFISYRKINDQTLSDFNAELSCLNWSNVLESQDVNKAYKNFTEICSIYE
jgi:exonuclease III